MTTSIAELRAEIDSIEGRRLELSAELDELAYSAKFENNKKAAERVEQIGAEIVRIQTVAVPALKAAVREAERREAAAKATASAEDERQRAEQALPLAEQLAEIGKQRDEAAALYVELGVRAEGIFRKLQQLGCPVTGADLRRVNCEKAHATAFLAIEGARPVAPNQRRTYAALYAGWGAMSINWVKSKLNTKAADDGEGMKIPATSTMAASIAALR